jgi:transcriptional regulator with XRE-family HTH domain
VARKRVTRTLAHLLGERIRVLRDRQALTQERLAWECGCSKSYMSRVEAGLRLPSLDVVVRIAARLDIEPRDLFIFPDRGAIDAAMERVRVGGVERAKRLLAVFDE